MSQETIARLFNNPTHQGPLPDADVTGLCGIPGEGPYLRIHLKFADDVIEAARFETYGCPYTVACGNWVAGWVCGRTVKQARILTAEDVSLVLGGLPPGKEHCAALSVNALLNGLAQHLYSTAGASGDGENAASSRV